MAVTTPLLPKREGSPGTPDSDEVPYVFPTWWFVVMNAHGFPMSILEGLLWTLIWPKQIADTFGNAEKVKVLGGLASLGAGLQWLMPLSGDLSDRKWSWRSKWCQRRPFVLAAHIWWTSSLALTWYGLSIGNIYLMVGANVIGSVGQILGDPNWGARIAETIPAAQRGARCWLLMASLTCCTVSHGTG